MKTYTIKNTGYYFAGWKLLNGRSVPSWPIDKEMAVKYSKDELDKFKPLRGYKRLGTVSIEET